MISKVLLLLFLANSPLLADENALFIEARVLFEAGDYAQGDALLKKGEERAKENWKKQYFFYDKGLSGVLKGKYTNPAQKTLFPPIAPKADYAKTYALFSKMRSAYLIKERSPKNLESLRGGVRLGSDISKSLKNYEITECALNKIKGAKECVNPPFLKKILKLSSQFKAEIASNYYSMRAQFSPPIEALLQFLIGQEKLLKTLEDLELLENRAAINPYLKKLYKETETFIPLMDRFRGTFSIEEEFNALMGYLLEKNTRSAEETLKKSIQKTKEFLSALFKTQEATTALYDLLESFQEAHLEEDLLLNTLKLLSLKQEETFKLKGIEESVPKEVTLFAKDHLNEAIKLLEMGDKERGESEFLFANFAAFSSLLYTLDFEKVPSRILLRIFISLMENVVEHDAIALKLNSEGKNALLFTLALLQEKIPLFDAAAFGEEVRDFNAKINRLENGSACVASPWEIVIPYFDKGALLIERSKKMVEYDFESAALLPIHSLALENWALALNALDNPLPPTTCPLGGGGGKGEEGESKPSSGGEGISEVLRNIVQMGEDDKEFEPTKKVNEKETLKPW